MLIIFGFTILFVLIGWFVFHHKSHSSSSQSIHQPPKTLDRVKPIPTQTQSTFSAIDQQIIQMAQQFVTQIPVHDVNQQLMGNDAFTQHYLNDQHWDQLIPQTFQLWQQSQQVWSQFMQCQFRPSVKAKLPLGLPSQFINHLKSFDRDRQNMRTGNTGEINLINHLQHANLQGHYHILSDVNLPFRYKSNEPLKQNQIDVVLVSTHGIFACEIKNYQAQAMSIEDINGIRKLYYENRNAFYDPKQVVSHLIKKNNTKNEYIVYKSLKGKFIVADARFNSIGFQTQNHRYALDRALNRVFKSWGMKAMDVIHSPVVYTGPQIGNIYNHSYFHRVQIYLANQFAIRLMHRFPRQVLTSDQVDLIAEAINSVSTRESQRQRWVINISAQDYHQLLVQWADNIERLKVLIRNLQN